MEFCHYCAKPLASPHITAPYEECDGNCERKRQLAIVASGMVPPEVKRC